MTTRMAIDHVVLPSFDLDATERFYREVLELPLIEDFRGVSALWGDRAFTLSAFGLHDGARLELFTVEGLERRESDGLPVGCVQGFCNMLWKLMEDLKGDDEPTHMAVIFDAKGKTFRDDFYAEYKAQRPPAPPELVPQFPLTRSATRAFNIPSIEMEGWEADDIIAT